MTLKELSQLYYLNREIEMDKRRLQELEVRPCRAPRSSPGCLTLPASRTRWVSMRRRLPI